MKAWDTVVIKADSNDANKGRAGVVQAVDATAGTVTVLLDATPEGKTQAVAVSKMVDVDVYPVM
jgi:hypothetical protein